MKDVRREAFSAFTHAMACALADPGRPIHEELERFHCTYLPPGGPSGANSFLAGLLEGCAQDFRKLLT